MGAFDVVVIGGGTAGSHVAAGVAAAGKSVALVEAGLIGGESGFLACLPSNSLLLSAQRGRAWADAVTRRTEVTGGLDDSQDAERLTAAGVSLFRGTGRVSRPGTVEVTMAQGGASVSLTYSDLVLATGCQPVAPPIEGLTDIPVWTTAQSLASPDLPRRLIVLGGGPAGCELTQVYASFGSHVTLVEAQPGLLPGEPAFAGDILATALRRSGADIYLGARATKAERTPDGLTLALEDGTRIDADRLLLASGRRPRLSGLGLELLGITVTPGLALPITSTCQVVGAAGQVWAAGDITGLAHTHAGHYQAQVVTANIAGQPREADYSAIPRCVFTTPAVYAVGAVPDRPAADGPDGDGPASQAQAPGLRSAQVALRDTTRGYLGADDLGAVELYADTASGQLVGAAAVGPDASGWMGEITLAIRAKIPLAVLTDVVHAFPTYGEALEMALAELAGTGGTQRSDQEAVQLSELDIQASEGDAVEQRQDLAEDETTVPSQREVPFGVNEADAAEQERAVGFGDEDYR